LSPKRSKVAGIVENLEREEALTIFDLPLKDLEKSTIICSA
jgi:hypothetical protein